MEYLRLSMTYQWTPSDGQSREITVVYRCTDSGRTISKGRLKSTDVGIVHHNRAIRVAF